MAGSAGGGRKYALTSDEDESDFWGFAQEARGFSPQVRTVCAKSSSWGACRREHS